MILLCSARIPEHTHTEMHLQICTYDESINNFKLSAFLSKIVYTVYRVRLTCSSYNCEL